MNEIVVVFNMAQVDRTTHFPTSYCLTWC